MSAQNSAAAPRSSHNRWHPLLVDAALALHDNRLSEAEPLLRTYLKSKTFDARAIRMLAELAGRIGRYKDAETLLRRTLELAPASRRRVPLWRSSARCMRSSKSIR